MILIVAHHYVINSGLFEVIRENAGTLSASIMLLFGAWGKTGINCFVLITGYFMCKKSFSWEKLIKLYLQILFYALIIYSIFCLTGHEQFSIKELLWKFMPFKSITDGFTSCFIAFYLFIPFLNIFIKHLDKKQHSSLLILLLIIFSILPCVPKFSLSFNYVEWFMVIYILAAYLRIYGDDLKISHKQWGTLTFMSFSIGSISILTLEFLYTKDFVHSYLPYFFISDSNKILPVIIAVSSFMYFKDIKMKYIPWINACGGATFGVLLIHANSDAMRQWLWKEKVDCIGNYIPNIFPTISYAISAVISIFLLCCIIEILRKKIIESIIFNKIYNFMSYRRNQISEFIN